MTHRRLPGRGRGLQAVRRTIQAGILILLIIIPVLSVYESLRNQRDEIGIRQRWDTRATHRLLGDLENREAITQSVRGSVWTLKAGDLLISDPLAVVDFVSASRILLDVFLLTALIPIACTVLLGRIFCGWICPADLLFEVAGKLRSLAGIRTDVTFASMTKYVVLLAGGTAALLTGSQVFAEIYPPRIVGAELYLWITFGTVGAGAWFLLAIVAFEIFVSRRFWCRYLCPGGALYSALGRWRLLRLKVDRSRCTDCRLCDRVCEFGLDPMNGRMGMECNNCGLCIRACGTNALEWRWSLPPADGLDVILPRRTDGPAARVSGTG